MSNPDEQRTSFIPPNFIEKGKILNGTFDIRNAIEAIIFALLIGVPVVHLPFSLTTRIIILCMTALPRPWYPSSGSAERVSLLSL